MRNKLVAVFVASALAQAATAQNASSSASIDELEQVVVTGTRVANRSALDTAVPVDVVPSDALTNIGVTEINQALSVALPSFNFPRPGLTDGTDTVRPATLRGLAPDQTLVLVNGKRRHSAVLVNVNGTIGRGASATDLNSIPTNAVRAIEVLRDGASAQYGSDAIAGVINLRLREDRDGGEVGVSYGWRDTSYENLTDVPRNSAGAAVTNANWSAPAVLERSRSDGETLTVSGWKGFALGDSGFLTIAAEYKDQKRTERAGYDMRQQYALVNGAFDPREATFNRFNAWYGEPDMQQTTIFANLGNTLSSGREIYANASFMNRKAVSAGFYRRALQDQNITSIYPNGFLPQIAPNVKDYSLSVGTRWEVGEWALDASLGFGYNEMFYTIQNTLNRTLGPTSKTVFNAGGFDYDQLIANVSAVRGYEVGLASPLNVAVGVEARNERYSITAGEPGSYIDGGFRPASGAVLPGAQVFPGFRPSNQVDESRNAVGAYIDIEANITEQLLGSAAIRAENYTDFGGNVSGKVALRYDFSETFALRGSTSTGFRAPSLQQQFFTTTSTNFISGIPYDITTFPVTDPVAAALGAQPLDAEESTNFSVGAVARLGDLSLTVDAYWINIDNRIVLSENLGAGTSAADRAVQSFLLARGFPGAAGRFFINGVDTETNGVDIVASYPIVTETAGKFDLTATANFNDTKVKRIPATPQLSGLSTPPTLFGRVNVLTFESGNPENKFSLSATWSMDKLGATLRATRYGDALAPGSAAATDFVLTAKTLVDFEARYQAMDNLKLAVGADNLLDEYPDPLPPTLNSTGATSFSNYSPFGRSGRFIYGRVTFAF
jgi:iron complex outermembrane receptor protein